MALKAGRVGVNPEDVDFMTGHIITTHNSEKEIIGYTADRKPIYRLKIEGYTKNINDGVVSDVIKSNEISLIDIYGTFTTASGNQMPVNIFFESNSRIATYVTDDGIAMNLSSNFNNRPVTIYAEYYENDNSAIALTQEE